MRRFIILVLEMDLRFGAMPRIVVVFNQGYEGFGRVLGTLFNRSTGAPHVASKVQGRMDHKRSNVPAQLLDGLRSDKLQITQTSTVSWNVNEPYWGWANTGFEVPPYASDLSLRLTLLPSQINDTKFKVRWF